MPEVSRYHPLLVALHWLLAILIIAALALGALVMARIPNSDPMKIEALRSHMFGGALILALMMLRLLVRTRTAHPRKAMTGSSLLDKVAWASHRLFYGLIIAMVASGVTMALQAGLFEIVYGGHGTLPPDLWVYPIRSVHYLISLVDGADRAPYRRRPLPHAHLEGRIAAPDDFRAPRYLRPSSNLLHRSTNNRKGAVMTYLVPAQAGAQFISLFVYALLAKWYVAPWLSTLKRADAIIALLWVHVFRYVALMIFSAQRDGFPISDDGLFDIVIGDVVGAAIALVAIFALRYRMRLGVALAWLLAAETIFDTVTNIRGGMREHLMGAASGTTWLVLAFYVPLIMVSVVLLLWQLSARHGEALDPEIEDKSHRPQAAVLRA